MSVVHRRGNVAGKVRRPTLIRRRQILGFELLEDRLLLASRVLDFNGLPGNAFIGTSVIEDGFQLQTSNGGLNTLGNGFAFSAVQGSTLFNNSVNATTFLNRTDGGNFRLVDLQLNSLNTNQFATVPFTASHAAGGTTNFSRTADANFNSFQTFIGISTPLSSLSWTQVNTAGDYHQFDNISLEIGPTITAIHAVSPDPRTTPVDGISLTLDSVVDLSTFTFADLSLTRNGVPVALNNTVTISNPSGSGYSIFGLGAFTSAPGNYQLTVNALNILSSSGLQGMGTATESWTLDLPPTVTTTNFANSGILPSGSTQLTATYNEFVANASNPLHYELRRAGADGLLMNSDAAITPTSVTVNGNIATLTFPALAEDTWRLTVKDTITDSAGNMLDGDANGAAGGNWQRDFVVTGNDLLLAPPISIYPPATYSPTNTDFGLSIAMDGNLRVVGAPSAAVGGNAGVGSVAVYDTNGALLTTLANPTPATSDSFGVSVAVSGNLVVVGAYFDDTTGADSGSAYVFNATTGALISTLANPSPGNGDYFGQSVSISGNTVVVGAYGDDTSFPDSGRAYVFNATTGGLIATLANPSPAAGDLFGYSTSVSGNLVAVGAQRDDTSGTDSGIAYVFNASTGALVSTLINPTPNSGFDAFGATVSIAGNTVAVGANHDNTNVTNAGSAYLFDATSGALMATLINPTPAANDNFGYSVSVGESFVVVGAYGDDNATGTDTGATYLFNLSGSLLTTLPNPTPATGDLFGFAVAQAGGRVMVADISDDTRGINRGAVYDFGGDSVRYLRTAATSGYTLSASADAGLRGDTRVSPEGGDDKLVLNENQLSYTLLKFDVSNVSRFVKKATVRMEWHTSTALNQGVGMYMFGNPWNESTVTWNNVNNGNDPFTAVVGGLVASVDSVNLGPGVHTGTFAEWDVTSAVRQWIAGTPNNGLIMRTAAGHISLAFHSKEGHFAPQLILELADMDVDSVSAGLGQLVHSDSGAFDGLNRLSVGGVSISPQSTTTTAFVDGGQTLTSTAVTIGGLNVVREVTTPNAGTQSFVRTIEVLANPTNASITVPVRTFGNLGSDGTTTVFATSDGDTIVEPTDIWFGTDDADGSGTPAIIHLVHGPDGPLGLQPTSVNVIEDNVEWTYNLTVAAGATKRLAHYTVLGTTRAEAIAAANALVTSTGFGGEAAAFLTTQELESLANFQFNTAPTDLSISSNTIAENLPAGTSVGTFSTMDANSGDAFTYSLVSGTGDTDNAQFTIDGNTLKTVTPFDFETKTGYAIRVRTTDLSGLSFEKALTISVTDLDEIPPSVTSTSFLATGTLPFNATALTVSFSEPVTGATTASNYELRRAGADGLLGTTDDPIVNISAVTMTGNTSTLSLGVLAEDAYRLTVKDTITDVAGNALDGDGNGTVGGNWQGNFVVSPVATFTSSSVVLPVNGMFGIVAADLNGDSNPDIAVTSSIGNLYVSLGNGSGGFGATVFSTGVSQPDVFSLAHGQISGSSLPELVVGSFGSSGVRVMSNNGNGSFSESSFFNAGGAVTGVAVGDINGDGTNDIVASRYNQASVIVFYLNSAGGLITSSIHSTGNQPFEAHIADLDGDGRLDIVTANSGSNSLTVLRSLGGGPAANFATSTLTSGGVAPAGVQAADFSGDGLLDLVTTNRDSSNATYFRNTGGGNFTIQQNISVGAVPFGIASIDYDRDGRLDLAVARRNGNIVQILRNVDGSSFVADSSLTTSSPFEIVAADFNKDGRTDLASSSANHSVINILLATSNSAPKQVSLTNASINENVATGSLVGTLSAADHNATDTHTFSLVSGEGATDNAQFSIVGNSLRTGQPVDYETQSFYSIRVRAADAFGGAVEKILTIGVNNLNESPFNIELSATSVDENLASGTPVGLLSTLDPDTADTFVYSLVSGTGDTDNGQFSIDGNTLKTVAPFDFEAKSSYSIRVRTTDQGGQSIEKAIAITVTDIEEIPPTVTNASFVASGTLAANSTSLTVTFSEATVGTTTASNYELRRSGADGLLGNTDDPIVNISSVTMSGNTATLSFAQLPEDVYSLTVKDTITDAAGNALDGDGNGTAGGNWRRDFVVGALSTSLTSPNGFIFDPEFGGFGAGQFVQGTGNAFDGHGRLFVNGVPITSPFQFTPGGAIQNVSATYPSFGTGFGNTRGSVDVFTTNNPVKTVAVETPVLISGRVNFTLGDQGGGSNLHVDAAVQVQVDGVTVGTFTYDPYGPNPGGSTSDVLFINFSALATLSAGTHTIRVLAVDGGKYASYGGGYLSGQQSLSVLSVNPRVVTATNDNGQTIASSPFDVDGIFISREVTIPSVGSQNFARTIDNYTNSTGSAIISPVRIVGNLGADDKSVVFVTSDGDNIVEPTDLWFGTDDADGTGTPAIIHLLHGPFGLQPSSVNVIEDNVEWTYDLTVPAGATKRLAHFTVLGTTRAEAIAAANALVTTNGFSGEAAAFLTTEELASLANFEFNSAPTDIELSVTSIAENNVVGVAVGTFSTVDPNLVDGDTFSYSLVAGTGSDDNAAFAIVGNQLRANSVFDFETKSSYSIRVRSTDQGGLSTEKAFAINVNDVAEDVTRPISAVQPLPLNATSLTIPIAVSGSDPTGPEGSATGAKEFDVYVAEDSGPFIKFATVPVSNPNTVFTAESNHTYYFRSIARDNATPANEELSTGADAFIRVGDFGVPVTQVTSANPNSAGLFTVTATGTKPSGTPLTQFELYVSVDGGATTLFATLNAGTAVAGVYSSNGTYQGLADGLAHSYRFFSRGRDLSGNLEDAPGAGDVTVNATFTAPPALQGTGIDVQLGATQRSYIRYLDVLLSSATGVADLTNPNRVRVEKFAINATNVTAGSGTNVAATVAQVGSTNRLRLDFGAEGLGGARNTVAGDGFYRVRIDANNDGDYSDPGESFEFHRLLGDANGDKIVDALDTTRVDSFFGQVGSNLEGDLNGDGVVNNTDKAFTLRTYRGRNIASALRPLLDD